MSTQPGVFVGQWTGHSRSLNVAANGAANVDYRTYRTCGQDPPPCDVITGNTISDGGHVALQISQVRTANGTSTASAAVTTSTDPAYPVGRVESFVLEGDIVQSDFGTFCDALASGQCGA